MYSIGTFAELTGLSIHTLRYYEAEGLLAPARDAGNRRAYSELDLAWVQFVQRLRETGMPIRQIRQYAALRSAGEATLGARLTMLEEHRVQLDEQIALLQLHRQKLDAKIAWYRQALKRPEGAAE